MNRTFWFVAGAGAGVYVVVKARRAAETFTPEGLRDRLSGLGVGAQLFADEVRAGMTEKETELRERLGWTLDGPPQLASRGTSGFETLAGARSSTTGGGAGSSTTGGVAGSSTTGGGAGSSTTGGGAGSSTTAGMARATTDVTEDTD